MNQNARCRLGQPGEYEVGYRRPPVHSRFQPGRSGNPRGRPRRLMPTANDVFSQELYRTVEVREGGKVTKMPLMQAVFRAFIAPLRRVTVLRYGPSCRLSKRRKA